MLGITIKYFFIIFCSIYTYKKLQNSKLSSFKLFISIIFSVIVSLTVCCTRNSLPYLTLIFIDISIVIFFYFINKQSFNKIISLTTISLGISYLCYSISNLTIGVVCYLTFHSLSPNILNLISYCIICSVQFIFILLLFKVNRFKKGLLIFEAKLSSDIGIFISVFLILIASFFNNKLTSDTIGTILIFSVLLIGILLLLWWRRYITNIYIEKVNKRNIEILETALDEQKAKIKELKVQNEELSKIIHKDNKMIPAMNMAVEEILNCQSADEQKEKSKSLLVQLRVMSAERKGIVTEYEVSNKNLPKTNISSIDASLKYLLNKANQKNIAFDLILTANIAHYLKSVDENDLNTLILDLGENAIIATDEMDIRNILCVIGVENESLCISFFDSAKQFEPNVVANMGIKRITTHKKTGGSGIGLMTVFEITQKHHASFVIDECIDNDSYSKCVSVCFDGMAQYRVNTERIDVISRLNMRDDVVLSSKTYNSSK